MIQYKTQDLNYQSVMCKIVACLCFAVINALLKSTLLPPVQIACFENLIGGIILWPFLGNFPYALLKKPIFWMRSVVATLGTLLWIYSVQHLSLFQSVALGFLGPCLNVIGAAIFIHEPLNRSKILAIVLSALGGTMVGVGPKLTQLTFSAQDYYIFLPIGATLAFSIVNVSSKMLLAHHHPTVLALSLLIVTGTSLIFFFPLWHVPHASDIWRLIAVGALTALAHLCSHWAMHQSYLTSLMPLGALRLIATAVLGWFFFQEWPTLWTFYGIMLIMLSFFFLARGTRHV